MAERTYLDYNATTPLDERVAGVLAEAQRKLYGNPSSVHEEGRRAKSALEEARESVASFAGCKRGEVIFTSSGTEANRLILSSASTARENRLRVLISAIEHPSVEAQVPLLEGAGCTVEEIPVNSSGYVDLAALEQMLSDDVAVVSVMTAHNETGVIQPVERVGELCRASGAFFHTDAVQAAGKIPLSWNTARPDYLVIAAHKFYGPKGIAAAIVREGSPLTPILVGGGQESGKRASTEAVPLAVGMAEACKLAGDLSVMKTLEKLKNIMESELKRIFSSTIYGFTSKRLPNTSFFSIKGVDSRELVKKLDSMGFAVSSGSACHGENEICPMVLRKMGFKDNDLSALRVSLGRFTSESDVTLFLSALKKL